MSGTIFWTMLMLRFFTKGTYFMELIELLELFLSADEDIKNRVFEILIDHQSPSESQELPSDIML